MCFSTLATANDLPLSLEKMGSFHIGGREVAISGKPVKEIVFSKGGVPAKVDPNGTYIAEGMYVQYFIPAERRGKLPLLMWHGGGMSGVSYETTPDGREGWLNWFLRRGWPVYNSDAVEWGRSGWAMFPEIFEGEPVFLARHDPFERFRIGAGPGSFDPDMTKARILPGSQFPVENWASFMKQNVPRWVTTDAAAVSAYTELVERVCPCVILAHSQGGGFAYKVAQAHPDKVKALTLIEPSTAGDPAQAASLKDTPILVCPGDQSRQSTT